MEYHSCELGIMLPTLRTMAPYRHESMSDIDGWEQMTPIEVLLYHEIEKLECHTTAELLEMCRFERVRVTPRFGVGQRRKFLLALAIARLRCKVDVMELMKMTDLEGSYVHDLALLQRQKGFGGKQVRIRQQT